MSGGLILLRHPPVSARGLCYGRTEVRLAPGTGRAIAAAVAGTPRARRLIASPARRCRGLAQALARAQGLALEVDPRLMELDFGAWEGRPWSAIPRAESDLWAEDPVTRAPPGGESFADLSARVRAVAHGLEDAILVTHAGPIRALSIAAGLGSFDEVFARPVPYASPIRLPGLGRA